MPRKPLLLQNTFPYHVTARANNKEWFYLPQRIIWEISCKLFSLVIKKYNAKILEFVLMSNHFHLLISTPDGNLDRVMNYFMREFSRNVGLKSKRINHVFGGRYKGCLIRDSLYFAHAYKYVMRNPIEARLSKKVEDYIFSTLQRDIDKTANNLPFPIESISFHPLSTRIPLSVNERIDWLNTSYSLRQNEILKNCLKKTIFSFPKHNRHQATVKELQT